MSEVKLVYKELEDLASHSRKVASKCSDYVDELNTKVTYKISGVASSPLSNGNSRLSSANYYVNQKKNELNTKKDNYNAFAKKVDTLIEDAKRADNNVGVSVNKSRESFLNEHKNLEGDGWSAFFANLVVEVPVLGWLVEAVQSIAEWGRDLKNTLRRWYEISGGKEWIDTALALAGVVLAVVGLIAAAIATGPWWVVLAGVVGAVIALANAFTNLATQLKANEQSDPAWAQYYGNQDTLPDWLRKTTFREGPAWLNKASMKAATAIEVTEIICNIISIGDGLNKAYKRSGVNKLCSKQVTIMEDGASVKKWKFDFSTAKKTFTTAEGKEKLMKTLKHSWKGVVFGDKGGFSVWKKQGGRAIKGIKNGDYTKIIKFTNKTLSGLNNVAEVTRNIGEGTIYGFDLKKIYSTGQKGYSSFGYDGVIKNIDKSYKTIEKVCKRIAG